MMIKEDAMVVTAEEHKEKAIEKIRANLVGREKIYEGERRTYIKDKREKFIK
ncbi:hypothetical protein SAMN05216390_102328 [Lachnospiraceae bacterium KH1T2]|nr:hypothetical protein SAMN05216390_102328 [Lachnospiraceae bacterium KH1T2]